MIEPRTLSNLYDAISEEYAWRITELSNFRSSVLQAKDRAQEGMIRAGIALLYAHWEGFVKKVADLYYSFVSYQNCVIGDLSDCFIGIVLRNEIESLQHTKKLVIHNHIIRKFFSQQNQIAKFSPTSPIKTSNLNYEIFEDVCIMIGIDIGDLEKRYKTRFNQDIRLTINTGLLEKRNFIAHGDYLPIKEKDYIALYSIIVNGLLYNFKELVMDSAQNKKYLR